MTTEKIISYGVQLYRGPNDQHRERAHALATITTKVDGQTKLYYLTSWSLEQNEYTLTQNPEAAYVFDGADDALDQARQWWERRRADSTGPSIEIDVDAFNLSVTGG